MAKRALPPLSLRTHNHSHTALSHVGCTTLLHSLIVDLTTLAADEVDFLDAVISPSSTSSSFKAYNEVISERGLNVENEVDQHNKLLKIGTLNGEN